MNNNTLKIKDMETNNTHNDDKKLKYNGWKAMPFVIGNETFEKLGTIGTSSNLLVYFTSVFNMKSMAATNVLNIFNGSANFGTLIGAYLCDTYFGRYNTLAVATISSLVGLTFLAFTAIIPGLHPPKCEPFQNCTDPTPAQLSFLLGGLVFMIIGAGGIRPCNLAFGADQFDPGTESGKRGISSFFNWYYFTLTFAVMVSVTFVVYIQSNISWAIGLAIPAFFMFCACALFFMGSKLYVRIQPQGSPLGSVAQVVVAAFKKRRVELVEKPALCLFDCGGDNPKLSYTDQFRFLEKAAIKTEEDVLNEDGTPKDPWKLCTMQQVEQVKCLIRVIPIWIAGIIYSISTTTMGNYTVFQALQSNRTLSNKNSFKIPAASYSIFTMMTVTLWIPFYDRIVVPKLRKLTGKDDGITVLQKLGIGIGILIFSLISAGLVENYRREIALTKPTLGLDFQRGAISSMSGMWLVIPLALAGLSEAFTMISLVEFYYKQFPENMRSMGAACLFCGMAMSSYLSSFLQSVVDHMSCGGKNDSNKPGWLPQDLNRGHLDYFYYVLAGLEVFNLVYFLGCAKWYRYRGSKSSDENKSEIALV